MQSNGRGPARDYDDVGAVVLVRGTGGHAERSTALLRHPLIAVALSPQLAYPLAWLGEAGISHIAVSLREPVPELVSWLAGRERTPAEGPQSLACVIDPHPRGPAGSVRDAALQVMGDRLVVIEGARLPQFDLHDLLATHKASGAAITTVIEHDRRVRTVHAPPQPGGVYVFEREVLSLVAPTGFHDIKQGLLLAANRKGLPVYSYHRSGITPAITDLTSFLAVSRWLVSHAATSGRSRYPDYRLFEESLIHPSAVVSSDAALVGPVLIGPEARLEAGSVVVGPSVIGPRAVVGRGSTVACSVLLEDAATGEGATADHAVLAPRAAVGAGLTVEYRLVELSGRRRVRQARQDAAGRGGLFASLGR